MARFHRYSANNILLIHVQRQDATRVAGFSAWRKLGRFVRRGEKGIAILVPMTLRRSLDEAGNGVGTEDGATARPILGFKPGYVFDVSQTDGEPLPAFAEVSGEPGDHVVALKAFLVSRGIELSYANAELGAAHGASLKGRILLRDDLSPAVEFSVLVHEIAHELLHTGDRRADDLEDRARDRSRSGCLRRLARDRPQHEHGGKRLHPAVFRRQGDAARVPCSHSARGDGHPRGHPARPLLMGGRATKFVTSREERSTAQPFRC